MDLPKCLNRGKEMVPGRFPCYSDKLVVRTHDRLITGDVCLICPYADIPRHNLKPREIPDTVFLSVVGQGKGKKDQFEGIADTLEYNSDLIGWERSLTVCGVEWLFHWRSLGIGMELTLRCGGETIVKRMRPSPRNSLRPVYYHYVFPLKQECGCDYHGAIEVEISE